MTESIGRWQHLKEWAANISTVQNRIPVAIIPDTDIRGGHVWIRYDEQCSAQIS